VTQIVACMSTVRWWNYYLTAEFGYVPGEVLSNIGPGLAHRRWLVFINVFTHFVSGRSSIQYRCVLHSPKSYDCAGFTIYFL
jgi:hypothetical protein